MEGYEGNHCQRKMAWADGGNAWGYGAWVGLPQVEDGCTGLGCLESFPQVVWRAINAHVHKGGRSANLLNGRIPVSGIKCGVIRKSTSARALKEFIAKRASFLLGKHFRHFRDPGLRAGIAEMTRPKFIPDGSEWSETVRTCPHRGAA